MEKVICYTYGQSRGNPGPAAIGVHVVSTTGEVLKEIQQTIGNASSHFAEYNAVMVALQTLKNMYADTVENRLIELCISSDYIKKLLNSESTITDPGLVPMFIEIYNLRVEFFPHLVVKLIAAEENIEARELVNCLLDGQGQGLVL